MDEIQKLKDSREYFIGMIRNLRAKKSEIDQEIAKYNRAIDEVEEEIRRKECECPLYSK